MRPVKSVAFHTLGCKLNFAESSTLARQFKEAGWVKHDFPAPSDVYLINTCSVTENADRECRSVVNRALKSNPSARIIVVGCYAQLKPDAIAAIPGVSLVLGASEKFNVLQHLNHLDERTEASVMACEIGEVGSFISSWSSNDRTRTFLKVQDGCDYSCTFCTIPLARGRSRSDTIDGVINRIQNLVESGVSEIVLTGVNLGDFGIRDASGRHQDRFIDLARAIDQVEGLKRVRISSIEPNLVIHELVELIAASDKFMPHFHMPLQSGSDEILGLMRRRYRSSLYRERVEYIRTLIPHASIGVDVITGFPGESDRHFEETYQFLHDLPVSYLHVFTYSERDHTPAALMKNEVPLSLRRERNQILRNLSLKKLHAFSVQYLGSVRPVLFEKEEAKGEMYGYTDNYIRVSAPYNAALTNRIIPCTLVEVGEGGTISAEPITDVHRILYEFA